jgi:hypothetical protein
MKCPCCKSELVFTHEGRYEDLGEHVCNPNGTPSMKRAYQCLNEKCVAHQVNASWIEDGEIFINPPENIGWSEAHRMVESASTTGTYYAIDSWNHHYELGKRAIKAGTRSFEIGKWKVNIIPKEKGWDYSEDQRHQPHSWKKKFEYWKKSEDGHGYVNVIPDIRMVRFCIRKFKNNYNEWKRTGADRPLKECVNEILCQTSWGSPDDRRYAKISSFLIKYVLYGNKADEIISAYQRTTQK